MLHQGHLPTYLFEFNFRRRQHYRQCLPLVNPKTATAALLALMTATDKATMTAVTEEKETITTVVDAAAAAVRIRNVVTEATEGILIGLVQEVPFAIDCVRKVQFAIDCVREAPFVREVPFAIGHVQGALHVLKAIMRAMNLLVAPLHATLVPVAAVSLIAHASLSRTILLAAQRASISLLQCQCRPDTLDPHTHLSRKRTPCHLANPIAAAIPLPQVS